MTVVTNRAMQAYPPVPTAGAVISNKTGEFVKFMTVSATNELIRLPTYAGATAAFTAAFVGSPVSVAMKLSWVTLFPARNVGGEVWTPETLSTMQDVVIASGKKPFLAGTNSTLETVFVRSRRGDWYTSTGYGFEAAELVPDPSNCCGPEPKTESIICLLLRSRPIQHRRSTSRGASTLPALPR